MPWNLKQTHFPTFVDKNIFTSFKHDVHVYVFTMMHVFVNCICKTPWKDTKVVTIKPLQHFINNFEKV
jgi:hypothetical protein